MNEEFVKNIYKTIIEDGKIMYKDLYDNTEVTKRTIDYYKNADILNKNAISYCIVANINTDSIDKIGDVTELEYKDLVEQLFGDIQQIKLLNDSLAGQQLPRVWQQGKVRCLVSKPKDSIILGLFYNESRSIKESICFWKEIMIEIDNS